MRYDSGKKGRRKDQPGTRAGLCRYVAFGELAAQGDGAGLGTTQMTSNVRDGRAYPASRNVTIELRQVVVDGSDYG